MNLHTLCNRPQDTGYILPGYTESYGVGDRDFLMVKLEPDGSMATSCPIQDCNPDTSSPIVTVTSSSPDTFSISVGTYCTPDTSSPSLTVTVICEGAGVEEQKSEVRSWKSELEVYPNPFTQKTVIRYSLSRNRPINDFQLTIHDLCGRLVRTLPITQLPNNPITEVIWDGRTEDGTAVPRGIYFCSLKTGSSTFIAKLLKLR